MKPLYLRSVAIGLSGILIIVVLYIFSAYMADQDMKEFHRIPRGYDNLVVGVRWWAFFFVATLVALGVIGAVSAWASRHDATSKADAIIAAVLAGGVPVGLATAVLAAILIVAFTNTPADHRMSFVSGPVTLFLLFLILAFIGLLASIAGGRVYQMLANRSSYIRTRR